MADYSLENGKGTNIREDAGLQEGYVDLDIDGLSEQTSPLAGDWSLLQRGNDDGQKISYTTVAALIKSINETSDNYDELWVGAGAMIESLTDGAVAVTVEYGTNDITHDIMRFAGIDNDTHAEFDVVMPPSWDRGTVKVKVYWTAGGDANPGEYVEFYVAAGARGNGEPLDDALGTAVNIVDQVIADDDLHITPASTAVSIPSEASAGPNLGDLIHFKLSRDWNYDLDMVGVDVDVLGVMIQFRNNREVVAW